MNSKPCPICSHTHASCVPCPALPAKPNTPAPLPSPDAPLVGQQFGSFRATKLIGKGGMGSVYLGEHILIHSKVAIKILHEHLAVHPQLVQRFYAEAKAVNLIGHANIVNIFDMNLLPPRLYFLIMEYLEGTPLNNLLTQPMECITALGILEQVCDALDAAHAHGVIHRDLKPENIFITKVGRNEHFVKVLDFGIAKLFSQNTSPHQTSDDIIVGTPEYMAPEQTSGLPVDARTDLYSLGVVAYAMATARLPFGGSATDLLLAHRERLPTPPHLLNPSLPKPWSDVILKALHKKPHARFQSAAEFAHALACALQPAPPPPAPSPTPLPASPPVIRAFAFVDSLHNPQVEEQLAQLSKRLETPDPYAQLELLEDAKLSHIRARVRTIQKMLQSLEIQKISEQQRQTIQHLKAKVEHTLATIGSPLARASFDAQQKNFRGIARSLAAGLRSADVELLRKNYLSTHPKAENIARFKMLMADALSEKGNVSKALQLMEEALSEDPLNLGLHQRYWTLRKDFQELSL